MNTLGVLILHISTFSIPVIVVLATASAGVATAPTSVAAATTPPFSGASVAPTAAAGATGAVGSIGAWLRGTRWIG